MLGLWKIHTLSYSFIHLPSQQLLDARFYILKVGDMTAKLNSKECIEILIVLYAYPSNQIKTNKNAFLCSKIKQVTEINICSEFLFHSFIHSTQAYKVLISYHVLQEVLEIHK